MSLTILSIGDLTSAAASWPYVAPRSRPECNPEMIFHALPPTEGLVSRTELIEQRPSLMLRLPWQRTRD